MKYVNAHVGTYIYTIQIQMNTWSMFEKHLNQLKKITGKSHYIYEKYWREKLIKLKIWQINFENWINKYANVFFIISNVLLIA